MRGNEVTVVDYEEEDVDSGTLKKEPTITPSYVQTDRFPYCCGIGVIGVFGGDKVEEIALGVQEALTGSGAHDPDSERYEYPDNDDAELNDKTVVLATTTTKQTRANEALEAKGFRPIIRFNSKTTRSTITLWARGKYTIIRPKE